MSNNNRMNLYGFIILRSKAISFVDESVVVCRHIKEIRCFYLILVFDKRSKPERISSKIERQQQDNKKCVSLP